MGLSRLHHALVRFGRPPPSPTPRSHSPPRTTAGSRQRRPAPAAGRAQPARRSRRSSNLDAAQFAPISSADALAQARASTTVRSNPWWGRLDTIPPASDERTMLIDRSLVAYGLLKPEELVEIHKIGDQMLEISGDRAIAAEQARAAVDASEAERKRLKEQKKAEAAERKRKHAEDVAHRKATDIIFLGRGVSRGLADRRANVEKLQAAGLPVLATPADVAQALGLSIPRLRWLAFHSDAAETSALRSLHRAQEIGRRARARRLRTATWPTAQRWIFQNILQRLPTHAAAHGFVKGRSIRTNAAPHVGRHTLVNADLKDFFPDDHVPSRARRLAAVGLLARRGDDPRAALHRVAAPQGRVRRPDVSRRHRAARTCRKAPARARRSRISSPAGSIRASPASPRSSAGNTRATPTTCRSRPSAEAEPAKMTGYLFARIRHIAQDEGFVVNEKKTRVLKRSTAMSVTGIVVNRRAAVRRREVRRLRAILHNAKKHGLASQNRTNDPHFDSHVRGRIAFVQMVNAEQGARLAAELVNVVDR